MSPPITTEDSTTLPLLAIHFGRTKTSGADHDEVVYLTGRPVEPLNAWPEAARIHMGSIFRTIDRWGNVSKRKIDPQSVNDIVKQRAKLAGLEPGEFSAYGLRSGYLTEAANRSVPSPDAMARETLLSPTLAVARVFRRPLTISFVAAITRPE